MECPKRRKHTRKDFQPFPLLSDTCSLLLAAPTGAQADDGTFLVHWETWCSLLALLHTALWVSSYTHHALRRFRRAAHSPRSKALPISASWPAQLEIPTMLRSECHTRCGACLFRCSTCPQRLTRVLCITIVCQHHVTGADTTKHTIMKAASAVSASKQGPSPVHDHLNIVRPEVRVRVRVRCTVCDSFPRVHPVARVAFGWALILCVSANGPLTPDSLLYNSISHCVLAEDPHRANPLII